MQAVVSVGRDDGRLSPLTDEAPSSALPLGNVPLLLHQVATLLQAGLEVLIVCPAEMEAHLLLLIAEQPGVELVPVEGYLGDAHALRAVAHRIRGDVLVLGGDALVGDVIPALASLHRRNACDVTMLLRTEPPPEPPAPAAKSGGGKAKKPAAPSRHEWDVDIVGISEDWRVVYKRPRAEVDGPVRLSKALLRRSGTMAVRTDLTDVQVYVFRHGVLALLEENHRLLSIRADLVPFLVDRQFQPLHVLQDPEHVPTLDPLRSPAGADAALFGTEDHLRCYALVVPHDGPYCRRMTTLSAYLAMDRDVLRLGLPSWVPLEGVQRRDQSVVSPACEVLPKASVRSSSVGDRCTIGGGSKLNGCIVMTDATVGQNCELINVIVASGATVGDGCKLTDCQVAPGASVDPSTRAKGDVFA